MIKVMALIWPITDSVWPCTGFIVKFPRQLDSEADKDEALRLTYSKLDDMQFPKGEYIILFEIVD